MSEPPEHRVDFRDLNWLGKTVFLGGAAMRLTANVLDSAVDRAAKIVDESRRAYEREMDPNIEDAKIIDERDDAERDDA